MTDIERQELFTLMGQWGRDSNIAYQKVREWIESREAEHDARLLEPMERLPERILGYSRDSAGYQAKFSNISCSYNYHRGASEAFRRCADELLAAIKAAKERA